MNFEKFENHPPPNIEKLLKLLKLANHPPNVEYGFAALIVNPNPKAIPLTVLYNNVQGLIDIRDLKSKEPLHNLTKLHELHGHIFTT